VVLLVAAGLGFIVVNWVNSPVQTGLRLAAGDGVSGDKAFLAAPGVADSGSSQVLNAVTSVGSTVVAVGSDTTSPVPRPLFLVSADGGATWELGQVMGPAGYEPEAGAAGRVAGGGGRWLAAGTNTPGTAGPAARGMWTSTDGRSWKAVDPSRLSMFWSGDRIDDLARTAYGFAAVGTTTLGDGRQGPVAWVSPDGQSWTRIDTRDIGTPDKVRGIRAMAAKGDAVVALADPGQGNTTSVILRSPDGGRHWLRTAAALPDVRPEPGALAVAGEGFLLVPTRQKNVAGQVSVYCSPEGAQWNRCGTIGTLGAEGSGVRGLASSAAGVAAVVESGWQQYAVFTSKDGVSWVKSADLGTIPGILRGIAITDRGTLVAGGDERAGDVDNLPVLMTAEQGSRAKAVPLGDIAGLSRSARDTTRVAAAGGVFVAVGSTRGDAGIWTSTDGAAWKTITDPVLGGSGRQALEGVARGPKGWLAVGSTMSDPVVTRPLLVTSRDGRKWQQAPASGAFQVPAGHYSLAPHAVAAGSRGYLFAGEDQGAGGTVPALWFSPDLRRYNRVDKLPAGGAGVRIHDVAATSSGYVAIGDSGAADRESGVVWVSDDGLNWTARGRVVPEGARSAGLRRVISTKAGVLAVGTAVTDQGSRPFAALSADDGKTWEYSWLPADESATVLDVTTADSGLIAVGSHGAPGSGDSAAWVSEDGRTWQRHTLSDAGLSDAGLIGDGTQWLGTVAALGDRVVAIGRSTTYTADHLTLWRTTVSR
jgi:hypothetical protein